ncbi:MAG TPA: PAS domain-containing protein [Candidatus Angelobacter sp.]|nr:PAS domain-containing protein [Candidatus Angelobacter sp.]
MSPTFKYSESNDPIAELVKINPVPSLLVEMKNLAVVVVNDATCKMLGYSEEELLAKFVVDLVPAEDASAVHHAAEEPAPEGETLWRCLRKDGKVLFLKLKYRETIYRGQSARFIVVTETSAKPFKN